MNEKESKEKEKQKKNIDEYEKPQITKYSRKRGMPISSVSGSLASSTATG